MFQEAWNLLFPKSALVVLNSYSLIFFAPVDKYLIKKKKTTSFHTSTHQQISRMVIELYQLIINFVQALFIWFFSRGIQQCSVKYLKEFTNYTSEVVWYVFKRLNSICSISLSKLTTKNQQSLGIKTMLEKVLN